MVLEIREETGVTVVELAGRVDLRTAGALKQRLKSLADGGRHCLVVDVRQVDFIDSAGLAALVSALKTARTQGGDLRLAGPQQPVRMVMEITRLHRTFDILESVGDAVESFAGHAAAVPAAPAAIGV